MFGLTACNVEVTDITPRTLYHDGVENKQTFTVRIQSEDELNDVSFITRDGGRRSMQSLGNDEYELTTRIGFCTEVAEFKVEVSAGGLKNTHPAAGYYTHEVRGVPEGCDDNAPYARAYTVDVTEDFVDARPGDGICFGRRASSKIEGCSLRAAVMESNAWVGDDLILLSDLDYELDLTGDEGHTDLDPTVEDLDIRDSVTIEGINRTNADVGDFLQSTFDNDTNLADDPDSRFAKIYGHSSFRAIQVSDGAVLRLRNLAVVGGATSGQGGGILNYGTISLERVAVVGNVSRRGGFSGAGIANHGSMFAEDYAITQNEASGVNGQGGGLLNSGDVTMKRGIMAYNDARFGAGITNESGEVNVMNSTFGLHVWSRNTPSTVVDNKAGVMRFSFTTFAGHRSSRGLLSSSNGSDGLYLHNSLLMEGPSTYCSGNIKSLGGNVTDKPCAFDEESGDGDFIDVQLLANTQFEDMGGFTPTIRFSSPNGGTDFFDPTDKATGGPFMYTDQRGGTYLRRVDGNGDGIAHADPGAWENPGARR
ncbi:MAG: hypothetical protein ACRBK7_03225 [Acidimicrobiales bacterium]